MKAFWELELSMGTQVIRHMDVVTVFHLKFLDEFIDIWQPYLFATELVKMCKLIMTLYRLKQALYVKNKILTKWLKKMRFI